MHNLGYVHLQTETHAAEPHQRTRISINIEFYADQNDPTEYQAIKALWGVVGGAMRAQAMVTNSGDLVLTAARTIQEWKDQTRNTEWSGYEGGIWGKTPPPGPGIPWHQSELAGAIVRPAGKTLMQSLGIPENLMGDTTRGKKEVMSGNLLGSAVCVALGIEANKVKRVIMDCVVDEEAVVMVYELVPDIENPTELFEVMTKYKAVPVEQEATPELAAFEPEDEDD